MTYERRSRTAQGVAAERALLTDLGVLDDPYAHAMLAPSMKLLYRIARRWPQRVPTLRATLAGLAARVLWHDAQITKALDDGIAQVVIVGAGYDSRAWRMRRDTERFFELDQGATQADKARRAPAGGPAYVQADLEAQSAVVALERSGFDPGTPAIFVLEGLTMYLTESVVRDQLRDLRSGSARGSRLTTGFHPPATVGTDRDKRQALIQRLARTGSGESFRLLAGRDHACEIVESSGWTVHDVTDVRTAAHDLVSPESGLPIEALSPHKTLLAATQLGVDRSRSEG